MEAMEFGLAIARNDDNHGETTLAEHLVASFIVQMHDSDNPTKVAMAAGAALALQCFENPHHVGDMAEAGADPIIISKMGIAVAKDIVTAHEVVHRIEALTEGMEESEVQSMVTGMPERKWRNRTDVMRHLETMLLEHKAKGD